MTMTALKGVASILSLTALCACVQPGEFQGLKPPTVSAGMADISSEAPDARYHTGINTMKTMLPSITLKDTPSLDDLINKEEVGSKAFDDEDEEDKLRKPSMRDFALSYGTRGGLAYASRQTNEMLQHRAAHYDKIYDFSHLVIAGPEGSIILPPVIVEAKQTFEMKPNGKHIRISDHVYEIVKPARFSPNIPLWHSFLVRSYSPPNNPPDEILPKTKEERKYWEKYVREGWEIGVKQANEILQKDINRLNRYYIGMSLYTQLLAEGKVSAPMVASGNLGVTGGGNSMRLNDKTVRITVDPRLNPDTDKWVPTITSGTTSDYITPSGSEKTHEYPSQADRQY